MTTESIKSTAITAADTLPATRPESGKGGNYIPKIVDATVHITTTMATGSKYFMARFPSDFIMKKLEAWLDAAGTTITGDFGLWYSDNAKDGTPAALAGLVINQDHFASAVALAAVVTPTEYTFEAGTFLGADTRLPAVLASGGLSAVPRGFVDLIFAPTSTTGSAADLNVRVTYETRF